MSGSQFNNLKHAYQGADVLGKGALVLSTWFGAGIFPLAPGTIGTLAGLPLVFLCFHLKDLNKVLFIITVIIIAVWAADRARILLDKDDPKEVVIDEVAGFLVAICIFPFSWRILFLGFMLFRLFDILKPFPIKQLEKLRGGWGIVLDDLLAGIYAALLLKIIFIVL